MVRSMMLGEGGEEEGARDNDSIVAMFHPGVRGQVLIGYSKEVVIVDIELGQSVGQINFDRLVHCVSTQNIIKASPISGLVRAAW